MSAASKALPRPCPTCGEVSGGVFCPQDGMPLEGAFTLGSDRYVLEELIGNGAMAIVFGGRHRTLSRPVAVKILRPEVAENADQQQRFLREARSASQLNHENIVGVLDFGWDDDLGVTYMVMERLFGQTLASQLGTSGRLAWREAMPLLVQVCRAVGAAHGLGIVHRDLTSRNVILVSGAGRRIVKLCDFGLSRQAAGGDRVTHNGAWVGTPAYMAPEHFDQLDPSSSVEASSDIYSIGVLAHEMITGYLPVEGLSIGEMVAAKLSDEPRRLGERFPELGLPEELDALVLRCLDRTPARRPTAAELERLLVRIEARATSAGIPLSSGTPSATPSGAPFGTPSSSGLHPIFPSLDDGGVPTMIGSYRVVRSLGSGGTGRVYLGEHPVIGSKVAIKVLLPEIAGSRETVERFIQEARTSSQIESPHIPRYYDFGRTSGGLPYAVMEYFEGETLAEHIQKHGALSVAHCADILGQAAGALTLAHQAGLVHRDLKPENIFLVAAEPKARGSGEHSLQGTQGFGSPPPDGIPPSGFNVKVLDFGIAKTFGKESGTRTQQGFFLGTPFYCAPEQVFGAEVDPRADVYGLGATAFEMLTGLPPFIGEISEVLEAKTSREAPLLGTQRVEISPLVEATVARMLARDPAARAPSMTWVQEQVATWLRPASQKDAEVASGRASGLLATNERRPRSSPAIDVISSASVAALSARDRSQPALDLDLGLGLGEETSSTGLFRASTPMSVPALPGMPRSAAAFTHLGEEPLAIEANRSTHRDAQDFDALETVTLLPGERPERVQVAMPPPRPRPPAWRRPLPMTLAAAAAVALVAIAYVGTTGGASSVSGASGASGAASGGHRQPVVSPIVSPIVDNTGRTTDATTDATAGGPIGAAGDPSGDEHPGKAGTHNDRRRDKRDKRDRLDKRDKRDKPVETTPRPEAKDPDPPKDVKFVDPFEK
jgi:serine/threonine protein kinase